MCRVTVCRSLISLHSPLPTFLSASQPWTVPSRCTFIQVLSSLSKLSILGDFTTWYESVGLDSVALVNTKGASPDTHAMTKI